MSDTADPFDELAALYLTEPDEPEPPATGAAVPRRTKRDPRAGVAGRGRPPRARFAARTRRYGSEIELAEPGAGSVL